MTNELWESLSAEIGSIHEKSVGLSSILNLTYMNLGVVDPKNVDIMGVISTFNLVMNSLEDEICAFEERIDNIKSQMEAIK